MSGGICGSWVDGLGALGLGFSRGAVQGFGSKGSGFRVRGYRG